MANQKELFISFLKEKTNEGSGKPSSYAKAMEVIESVLFTTSFANSTSIWEFVNISNVDKLYSYILKQQNSSNGIFANYRPKSYWKDKYCSAALKEYKLYLQQQNSHSPKELPPKQLALSDATFDITKFAYSLSQAYLLMSPYLPYRFISSLLTKPFVILTGLSGAGKTKLAEAFSLWITQSDTQYCMVAVGADWTNREPLLGFPNALDEGQYVKPDSGTLDLIIRAEKDLTRPYFLILDEMNMSHVERYFADFLSAMEATDRTISLHPDDWGDCDVPKTIKLLGNLFLIGTVNIDETTYMFSPKVLDRANVIEFRVSEDEIKSFFKAPQEINMDSLRHNGSSMGESFVTAAQQKGMIAKDLETYLVPFFRTLKDAGAEFGYRTASEMSRFVAICSDYAEAKGGDAPVMTKEDIIDAAVIQKLLPKVHGSRNKTEKILKDLALLCLRNTADEMSDDPFSRDPADIKYPLTHEKLSRMYNRVISDGFTSFAEA